MIKIYDENQNSEFGKGLAVAIEENGLGLYTSEMETHGEVVTTAMNLLLILINEVEEEEIRCKLIDTFTEKLNGLK